MKATYNKSKIMKNAWYLKKVQPGKSLGDCLRKAWRNEKLAMLTAKIEIKEASEIANIAGKIINGAKAEMMYRIARKEKPSIPFFDADGK